MSFHQLHFEHALGNLDMKVYDAAGNLIQRAASTTDNEVITLNHAQAGDYVGRILAPASQP